MKTLDCRADKCPHPVIETRRLLLAEPGLAVTVLVGDETARENISRLARSQGYEVKAGTTEGGFALVLTPGERPTGTARPAVSGKTVAFITADVMGSGNDELGHLLLKNFLFTLAELENVPDTLLFVNMPRNYICSMKTGFGVSGARNPGSIFGGQS